MTSNTSKRHAICICDTCGIEFEKKFNSAAVLASSQSQLTFCGRECTTVARKKGGKLQLQISQNRDQETWQRALKKTMLEKHGVENPGQMTDHYEKCKSTLQQNYGVDCPMNIPHVRAILAETTYTNEANLKRSQTNIQRYGHENVFGSKSIQKRITATLQNKYYVSHSSHIPKIGFKRRQSIVNRFGSYLTWTSQRTQNARANGTYKIAAEKRHQTMKLKGTYMLQISREEDRFHERLCSLFNIDDINRQVIINNWCIDFYIKSIDTYIQYDSIYWHGLDRSIEEIMMFKSPRDKTIFRTTIADQTQNRWFHDQDMKLIRFRSDEKFENLMSLLIRS